MKKALFLIGITTLFSITSFAQKVESKSISSKVPATAQFSNSQESSNYLKSLGVSDENIADAQKIIKVMNDKINAVSKSDKLSPKEKQQLISEYQFKRNASLKDILGEEVYNKYQQHVKN